METDPFLYNAAVLSSPMLNAQQKPSSKEKYNVLFISADGLRNDEAIRILEENKDEHFFLAVGYFSPHSPYVAPKKYFDLYDLDKIPLPKEIANDRDDVPDAALFTRPSHWGVSE